MTRAEFQIESTLPGGVGLGGLFAASVESLNHEPAIRYEVSGASAVIAGDHRSVLAALKRLEQAFCATCAEGYLITIRIDDNHEV